MKINTLHLHYEYSHRHQPLYFNQTMGELLWRCFIFFFFQITYYSKIQDYLQLRKNKDSPLLQMHDN